MKTKFGYNGVALSMLLAGLGCLAGCESGGHFTFLGYTTQPTFDPGIQTIYVPIASNYSYRKGLEFDLTTAVQHEIMQVCPFRLTSDRRRADTELVLKIVNRRKNTILFNQLGEARDVEIALFVEVVWRDLRPGKLGDILSNPKKFDPNEQPLPGDPVAKAPSAVPVMITPAATYVPELGGSTFSAEQQAINRAAQQIVQMMEVWR